MDQTQFDVTIKEINKKVSLMYHALVGNEITKDGGLIQRVTDIESDLKKQEQRMDQFHDKLTMLKVYEKVLWLTAGGIISGIIGYLINHV